MKKQVRKTIGSTLIVGIFLLFAFGSEDEKTSSNKESSKSEIVRVCAVVSAPDNPGSFNVSFCREDFSSEQQWKERIERAEKSKSRNENGLTTYDVSVKYQYFDKDNRIVKETYSYEK